MESVKFCTDNIDKDIAILKINNPRPEMFLHLETITDPIEFHFRSLSFPIDEQLLENMQCYPVNEFFHEGNIITGIKDEENSIFYFGSDNKMINGSSGCPRFYRNGNVFGMLESTLKDEFMYKYNYAKSLWISALDIYNFVTKNGISLNY